MNKTTALEIAEEHFPHGPEQIAKALGAEVTYAIINVDGWCIPCENHPPIITINKNAPRTRQRFSLAHELAHILLGTKPEIISGKDDELYDPKSSIENDANQLASELLLPLQPLRHILHPPIDSRALAAAAKYCGVSEVALVLRLVHNALIFGLDSPIVARLADHGIEWKIPYNQPLSFARARKFYDMAIQNGGTVRTLSAEGEPILVCASNNVTYRYLLYYWLLPEHSTLETPCELRVRLEADLFGQDTITKQYVNSCLGAYKTRMAGLDLEAALAGFHERYGQRLVAKIGRFYPSPVFDE